MKCDKCGGTGSIGHTTVESMLMNVKTSCPDCYGGEIPGVGEVWEVLEVGWKSQLKTLRYNGADKRMSDHPPGLLRYHPECYRFVKRIHVEGE